MIGDQVGPVTAPDLRFKVPRERIPTSPPERRGIARDEVRLLVASPRARTDARFHELGRFLRPGDLLVVNTSTTRPAAVGGAGPEGPVVVHVSSKAPSGGWIVELRRPDGRGPVLHARTGWSLTLEGGATVLLRAPVAAGPGGTGTRLWLAEIDVPGGRVSRHLARHGRPITYGPDAPVWPLEDYQTVFARHPGSAEMPSAGRPFSLGLVTDLVARGIGIAPLQLHAGVSSQEAGEAPGAERYVVGPRTASLVNHTRRSGGRVVAVGTTVTRALETVAAPDGTVREGRGWTDLVITPDRGVRVVDGLISGWHEADASHLLLLSAVAGPDMVRAAYAHALAGDYLWHEFGDTALFLP